MKKTFKLFGLIALVAIIGFSFAACSNGSEEDSGPPSSVDGYSNLEPKMAPNPNRAVARAGGTAQIGVPDYLSGARAAATVNATFKVHDDDTDIAEIVGSATGSTCRIKGLKLGSARIIVTVGSQSATVIIAVAPNEALYRLPAGAVRRLGNTEFYDDWYNNNKPDNLPDDISNYKSEPTYQLAWNWRNPSQGYGASGKPCGIDVLGYFVDPAVSNRRGWVRTTYGFGGWHYDLNDKKDNMTDGVQIEGDVKLELKPEFIYDNGVPYLQITHELTNTGSSRLTDQKFGASADVMIFNQDDAPLTYLQYGALMTNEHTSGTTRYLPTLKLRLVCQNMQGINNVSTMWFGRYMGGSERNFIYEDKRVSITADDDLDTALNFSYKNISLAPGEKKTFVVRFTQVQ